MHNNVCLDFDGGSSSKARLGARITKVSQTNIDEFLLDFFWRYVNFCFRRQRTRRRKLVRSTQSDWRIRRRNRASAGIKKIAPLREPFW
ncbi:hypothetical protein [Mesorhizobium sp.]|uniref:hypothetical protein n=1 Tax=Mesorhizobium sp. TaxID=1871066 RepID=UPI0025BCD1BC|nr:hypothetical protein [Mesorhizobium sp.]